MSINNQGRPRGKHGRRPHQTVVQRSSALQNLSPLKHSLPTPKYFESINQETFPDHVERFRQLRVVQVAHETLQKLNAKRETLRQLRDQAEEKIKLANKDREMDNHTVTTVVLEGHLQDVECKVEQANSDLKALEAPHRIRRCQRDILQYIFECAVQLEHEHEAYFRTALALSHVSYRWRQIALETAVLWTHCTTAFRFEGSGYILHHRWCQIAERVKGGPIKMSIRIWKMEHSHLRDMSLAKFDNIDTIELKVYMPAFSSLLFKSSLHLHPNGVRHLKIGPYQELGNQYLTFDPSSFIEQICTLKRLESINLHNFDFEYFPSHLVYEGISSVQIGWSRNLNLVKLSHTFPNVKSVSIMSSQLQAAAHPLEKTISWPELEALVVRSQLEFPWETLVLPKIRELCLPERSETIKLEEFLTRHHTLQIFDSAFHFHDIANLGKNASQLTSISLTSGSSLRHINWLDFPSLLSLTIYDTHRSIKLPCQEFDCMVRALLPDVNTVAAGTDWSPPVLTILTYMYNSMDCSWMNSIWIPSAYKSESFVIRWGRKYHSFCFQWP